MLNNIKLLCLVVAGLLISSPATAVDLVGVHDLALEQPRSRAG